jgi:hypothetical protein
MNCRHCGVPLTHTFLDLGHAPPSNAYLSAAELNQPEIYYPLKIKVCDACWLVQTEDYADADALFTSDYAYFSSTSSSWLNHAEQFANQVTHELGLTSKSLVIEVASNDGYLLKNFIKKNIPCFGIEPTASTAVVAEKMGISVLRDFFGESLAIQLAEKGQKADLIIGNNVFAHVPNINDFSRGLKALLKPEGTITLEFPHLMQLIEHAQFDTIYHEHFSYLSLLTVTRIFCSAGLRVWRVENLSTHGGSLRVYGCHDSDLRETQSSVTELLNLEINRGIQKLETYLNFQPLAEKIKNNLINFLVEQKKSKKNIAAYGAAAKGNTLLNFAGVKPDLLSFVCDAAFAKQGKFLPGSHVPILAPSALKEIQPDFVIIFPWNIASEIAREHSYINQWGGIFLVVVPEICVIEAISDN